MTEARKMAKNKADEAPERRRPYNVPTLLDYGAVAKLTQGSQAVGSDSVSGMMNACL